MNTFVEFNKLSQQGELIKTPWGKIFFGRRNFFPKQWGQFQKDSSFLNQVHGNAIVEGNTKHLQEADGHWTHKKNVYLFIRTADCMPVFLFDQKQQKVFALHIGWRGLASNILTAAVEEYKERNYIKMWIGPHIHRDDFYLNLDNVLVLKKSHKKIDAHITPSPIAAGQYCVDLKSILIKEAEGLGLLKKNIWTSPTNTYRSSEHHSHRRFSGNKGRQYSFIVLD